MQVSCESVANSIALSCVYCTEQGDVASEPAWSVFTPLGPLNIYKYFCVLIPRVYCLPGLLGVNLCLCLELKAYIMDILCFFYLRNHEGYIIVLLTLVLC